MTNDPLGGAWLAREYGIRPVQRLRTHSYAASTRRSHTVDGHTTELFPDSYRPSPDLSAHLEFMLKHEAVHLEFLARLFEAVPSSLLESWIASVPMGRYARRAGFFYEWLTGLRLNLPDLRQGNNVDALDGARQLVATRPTNVPRWRVRDNLPGTAAFCPVVFRTDGVRAAEAYRVEAGWAELEGEFGADLLARSAVWLTIKESRASFAIEREADEGRRIQRFAAAMELYAGEGAAPLSEERLAVVQRAILGDAATRYGLRRSPVFVGEFRRGYEVVHYVAPNWEDLPAMIAGLAETERRTRGASPLVRAAALSFGFVYLHPLSDGNGRISRFLVNDVLRRDGAVPAPFVLPVSAVIAARMSDYDRTLERFSRPLMDRFREDATFGPESTYPDGIVSNFRFEARDQAAPAWRYPDLTDHVPYLHETVRITLETEMRQEAATLRTIRRARTYLNEVIEGPDSDLDRIARSIRDSGGTISGKLLREFPLLADEALAERAAEAVDRAYRET